MTLLYLFVLSLLRKAYYSEVDNKECKGDVAPHAHYNCYLERRTTARPTMKNVKARVKNVKAM